MKLRTTAAVVAAIAGLAAGGLAHAGCASVAGDTAYDVSATFVGGGTVTGCFYIDVSGYFDNNADWSLTTTAAPGFPGFTYDSSDTYYDNTSNSIDLEPGYDGDLHLVYADPLTTSGNTLVPAESFECINSYSCYPPTGGANYRYLASPEPSGWALMLAGAAIAGAGLRRRRTLAQT